MTEPLNWNYHFDQSVVHLRRRLLLTNGEPIPLPPKVFDLLVALVQSNNRAMKKDELMKMLWPEDVVEESNLTQCIFLLRTALGERASEHRYVVTLPGRGYRFVPKVRKVLERGGYPENKGQANAATKEFGFAIRSIAVIPFRSLNTDLIEESLGPGIAETLTARLSVIPGLNVRLLSSTAVQGNGLTDDAIRIGRRLRVASLLCGSLQRSGDRIRVTVEIVNAQDGVCSWSRQFEANLRDIFLFQDSIAQQVVDALLRRLTKDQTIGVKVRTTENAEAYLTYLKGQYFLNKRTPKGFHRAREYFESAIRQDPDYGLAFAGLAQCYNLLACYSVVAPQEGWPKAKAAALRALETNNQLADAHAALGLIKLEYERDWTAAERECMLALSLNANHSIAYDYYAEYCICMGLYEEAIAAIRQAQQLDPLSLIVNCDMGRHLFLGRRYEEAIRQLRNTVEMDPNFALARRALGWAYEAQGLYQEALSQFEEAFKLFDSEPSMLASIGHLYAVSGNLRTAREVFERLVQMSQERYVSAYDMAIFCTGLGESAEAFNWLEQAREVRAAGLAYAAVEPRLDPLHPNPRLHDLLRRIGLTWQHGRQGNLGC